MQYSELKDHIKSIPISGIIGKYIPLKKQGANHEAVCPFHNDHNPSLKVNDSKGLFKCFVCGEAGDAISFVEKFRSKSFIETLDEIADSLGIQVEKSHPPKNKNPKFTLAFRILTSVGKIYRSYAISNKPKPFFHFLENRKIPEHISENFQLGFAPNKNIIVEFLEKKQKELPQENIIDLAIEIGVIKKGKFGLIDTFRNRIVFPIWDQSSQVRGFGSRSIHEDQIPKYLNSKESFIFNKRFLLYGFNLARNKIRENDRIILTEGYMDAIALHQEDFIESTAVMGIALSDEKAKQIQTITPNVYLAFDNDQAGFNACLSANEKLLRLGIIAKRINLGDHKDPDDFVKKEGKLEFQKKLEQAPAFIDSLIETILTRDFGENTDLKLNALDEVFEIVSPLKLNMAATERILETARKLGLRSSHESIIPNYKEFLKKNQTHKQPYSFQEKDDTLAPSLKLESGKNPQNSKDPVQNTTSPYLNSKIDKWVLVTALSYPWLCEEQKFTEMLDFARNKVTKDFVLKWGAFYKKQKNSGTTLANQVAEITTGAEYPKAFKNLLYASLFHMPPKTTTHNTEDTEKSRLLTDLSNKVKMEKLKEDKSLLMKKRLQLTKKNELEAMDLQIIEINKKIANTKMNKNTKPESSWHN